MVVAAVDQIQAEILTTEGRYFRLILVVGLSGTGKTATIRASADAVGLPVINLSLFLAENLLDLPRQQRILKLGDLLMTRANASAEPVLFFDDTELLFDAELRQDPLKLLQSIARHKTVVATWNGDINSDYLSYADPGHPEFRKYSRRELTIIEMTDRT